MKNLVVIGNSDHGKTSVLKAFKKLLEEKCYRTINIMRRVKYSEETCDIRFLVLIDNVLVGVNSQGDSVNMIARGYWALKRYEPDFYVMTGHNKQEHFDKFNELLGLDNYAIFKKEVGDKSNDKHVAEQILDALLGLIKVHERKI